MCTEIVGQLIKNELLLIVHSIFNQIRLNTTIFVSSIICIQENEPTLLWLILLLHRDSRPCSIQFGQIMQNGRYVCISIVSTQSYIVCKGTLAMLQLQCRNAYRQTSGPYMKCIKMQIKGTKQCKRVFYSNYSCKTVNAVITNN